MTLGRWMTESSHGRTKETVDAYYSHRRGNKSPLSPPTVPADPPIVRLGKIYNGPILAAEYDGSGTLTKAIKCEVILHRIRADGSQMEDFETTPEVAYSIVTPGLADGAEVVLLRDRTINDPDNPNTPQPGYVAIAAAGGSSFLHKPCELCMATPQTVTTDAWTRLRFDGVKNLNTAWYSPADSTGVPLDDADEIQLLQQGWYELGYSIAWDGPITSAGGTGIAISHGTLALFDNDDQLQCTGGPHDVLHDNASGASLGGSLTRQILFRRGGTSRSISLRTQNGSATHNRTFSGVFWANYLGHDFDLSNTIGDGS